MAKDAATVRLESQVIARLDNLIPYLEVNQDLRSAAGSLSRATLHRIALVRGIELLEEEAAALKDDGSGYRIVPRGKGALVITDQGEELACCSVKAASELRAAMQYARPGGYQPSKHRGDDQDALEHALEVLERNGITSGIAHRRVSRFIREAKEANRE